MISLQTEYKQQCFWAAVCSAASHLAAVVKISAEDIKEIYVHSSPMLSARAEYAPHVEKTDAAAEQAALFHERHACRCTYSLSHSSHYCFCRLPFMYGPTILAPTLPYDYIARRPNRGRIGGGGWTSSCGTALPPSSTLKSMHQGIIY